MKKEKLVLNKLKKEGYIKNGCLNFDLFKPFMISRYYISKIDKDEIVVLESQNKKFEYWVKEELLIPPWITHWFQLNENIFLRLKNNFLEDLIKRAIKKAGNIFKLTKILGMTYPTFYNFINKKRIKMISVKKLRRILLYLNIKYASINNKIEYTKKGNKISIQKPKFPINLASKDGASLLGMVVSDGCIYLDKQSRGVIRTKYAGGEKESIHNFMHSINSIYGKTLFQKERIRNCDIIKIGSSIIGETLFKAGAILGNKAKVNGEVPWLISYGAIVLKINYLRAVFSDEGCIYSNKTSYICLSRYKHIKLNKKQLNLLKILDKKMRPNKFPTGHIYWKLPVKTALHMIKDKRLAKMIKSKPKLLLGESDILTELGIEHRLWNRCLNKTTLGRYSLCCDLFISKKGSIIKFYAVIGFMLKYKQKKLITIIKDWEAKRVKSLQHTNEKKGDI